MYCPHCGTENENESKFCRSCGAPLVSAAAADPDAPATPTPGARQAQASDETQTEAAAQPQTPTANVASENHDSHPTAQQPAQGYDYNATYAAPTGEQPASQQSGIGAKVAAMPTRQKAIIGGVAAVVVIAIIAIVMVMNGGPSNGDIEQLVQEANLPKALEGESAWGNDGAYKVASVDVLEKSKDNSGEQSAIVMGVKMSDPYTVKLKVTLDNGATRIVKQGNMHIAKVNGQWESVYFSSSSLDTTDIELLKGVSEKKIKKNIVHVLSKVDQKKNTRLSNLYDEKSIKSIKDDFDSKTKTDTVTIKLKNSQSFCDAEGTVTAKFVYDGKLGWSLTAAEADDKAFNVSYQKLLGTWNGKLDERKIPDDGCLGAKNNPMKITITNVDEKSGKVSGIYTMLAHFHEDSNDDEQVDSDPGDTVLADVPFEMEMTLDGSVNQTNGMSDTEKADNSSSHIEIRLGSSGMTAVANSIYYGRAFVFGGQADYFEMTKEK